MIAQYDDMLSLYGTRTGVNLARKHIGWYTKGLPGSAELRNSVNSLDDPRQVIAMLARILRPLADPKRRLKKAVSNSVFFVQRSC